MGRLYVNNFSCATNGDISDSATSITITSSTNLPTLTGTQYYYLTLGSGGINEIVKVTARSGLVLTVVRAQEGTTGTAWTSGTPVELRATANSFAIVTSPTENTPAHWDGSLNLSANNHLNSYTTTATAAGTTTLTVTSTKIQYFTGSTTQTVVMPVTSTLTLGFEFDIVNKSSDIVTVQSSGANTILAMAAGTRTTFTCILTSGTTAASWDYTLSSGSSSNSFTTIAVSGQSDVVADSSTDTLTLAAGSGITLTTNAGTDTVTIAASGGGTGDVVGPASATSGAVALYDGTTGKLIKNGGALDALVNTLTVGLGSNAVASNTAFGLGALAGGTLSGTNTIGIGKAAGDAITSGTDNICIGTDAGGTITSSSYGVYIGTTAGGAGTTGCQNRVAIGYQASGGASSAGTQDNVTVGYQAGKDSSVNYGVFVGSGAGMSNVGNLAVAVGYQALGDANAASQGAICVGYQAGMRCTGSYVVFMGVSSGGTNAASVSGDYSVGIGYTTLGALTSGSYNVAVGGQAMTGVTTGGNNTGIGKGCGVTGPSGAVTLTTGTSNTLIGYRAGVDTNSAVGAIALGCDAVALKSTGATSADHGPGIAIGSAGFPVGFRGDGTIYPSSSGGAGFQRMKINGTQYFVPLFADGATAISSGGGGGMTMNTASGTTQAAAVNNGYICTNASQCNVTLPGTAAVGDLVKVVSQGAGGIKVTANTGQTIKGLADTTTSAGSITCAAQYDSIQVICVVANTTWVVDTFTSSLLTFA